MIKATTQDREARALNLNPAHIASINDPLAHQFQRGVRAVITMFNGDIYEVREDASALAVQWFEKSAK